MKLGDKVIVCSGDPKDKDNLAVGFLIGYEPIGKIYKTEIPRVLIRSKEYLCFGIVEKFEANLMMTLTHMQPKEQWNYLIERRKK